MRVRLPVEVQWTWYGVIWGGGGGVRKPFTLHTAACHIECLVHPFVCRFWPVAFGMSPYKSTTDLWPVLARKHEVTCTFNVEKFYGMFHRADAKTATFTIEKPTLADTT